ncbi:unnamed protein product, partial [Urochloa humidicola]
GGGAWRAAAAGGARSCSGGVWRATAAGRTRSCDGEDRAKLDPLPERRAKHPHPHGRHTNGGCPSRAYRSAALDPRRARRQRGSTPTARRFFSEGPIGFAFGRNYIRWRTALHSLRDAGCLRLQLWKSLPIMGGGSQIELPCNLFFHGEDQKLYLLLGFPTFHFVIFMAYLWYKLVIRNSYMHWSMQRLKY